MLYLFSAILLLKLGYLALYQNRECGKFAFFCWLRYAAAPGGVAL